VVAFLGYRRLRPAPEAEGHVEMSSTSTTESSTTWRDWAGNVSAGPRRVVALFADDYLRRVLGK
jgi:hypothetical protein